MDNRCLDTYRQQEPPNRAPVGRRPEQMRHQNPPEAALGELLATAGTIAMVGASSDPRRPAHGVMRFLLDRGFRVVPVNPTETEVHGQRAWPSLESVPEPVDIVDVFRRPDATPPIADAAVKIGARALWLQLGVVNEEAAERASRAGLIVVMDR